MSSATPVADTARWQKRVSDVTIGMQCVPWMGSMQGNQPLRGANVRVANENLILRLIREEGALSQSRAAQMTGLKAPTILRIYAGLERRGLIQVATTQHEASDRKGRRPVAYSVNRSAFHAVGIDFWAQQISLIVEDFSGEVLLDRVVDVREVTAEAVFAQLIDLVRDSMRRLELSPERILGIGIGCPGMVDIECGTIRRYPRIAGIEDYAIRDRVADTLGVPVYVHNTGSVVAMSEYRYGSAADYDSLLSILVRSGVGGAFISDGRILVNHGNTVLEVGHMSVDRHGRQCRCGSHGCLEAYFAEEAILQDLKEVMSEPDPEKLPDAVMRGEPKAVTYAEEMASILALGFRNLIQLLSPRALLIVSRCKPYFDLLAARAQTLIDNDPYIPKGRAPAILSESYNPKTAGRGACDLVFDGFLETTVPP
jgi:predicted NBD/HSP70 family sugar kinase